MIRKYFYVLLDGQGSLGSLESSVPESVLLELEHTQHCFDYLRQGIMCAGDMTVEWASKPNSSDINGLNIPHGQCKSWVSNLYFSYIFG
jgi:hypothetical protein